MGPQEGEDDGAPHYIQGADAELWVKCSIGCLSCAQPDGRQLTVCGGQPIALIRLVLGLHSPIPKPHHAPDAGWPTNKN